MRDKRGLAIHNRSLVVVFPWAAQPQPDPGEQEWMEASKVCIHVFWVVLKLPTCMNHCQSYMILPNDTHKGTAFFFPYLPNYINTYKAILRQQKQQWSYLYCFLSCWNSSSKILGKAEQFPSMKDPASFWPERSKALDPQAETWTIQKLATYHRTVLKLSMFFMTYFMLPDIKENKKYLVNLPPTCI